MGPKYQTIETIHTIVCLWMCAQSGSLSIINSAGGPWGASSPHNARVALRHRGSLQTLQICASCAPNLRLIHAPPTISAPASHAPSHAAGVLNTPARAPKQVHAKHKGGSQPPPQGGGLAVTKNESHTSAIRGRL
eukprot:5591641-Prymnesium_polylepis.1